MKKSKMILIKLALFLFVSLMVVCNIHTGAENEKETTSLRILTVAEGSDVSPLDDSDEDVILQEQYDAAQALFEAQEYEKAFEAFEALGKFSNSHARAADSKRKWRAASYKEAMTLYNDEQYHKAKEIFESLENYEKSRSYLYKCTMAILRMEYQQAKEMYDAGDYENARILFESLGKFHDSPKRAQDAADMVELQKQAEKELNFYETALALKEAGDLEGARDALIEAGDCQDATDQLYSIIRMLDLRAAYERAEEYFNGADYENAHDLFSAMEDYENSAEKAKLSKEAWYASVYEHATIVKNNDPSRACILFLFLGDYRDSASLADRLQAAATKENVYAAADAFAQDGDYLQAMLGFEAISAYADSRERIAELSKDVQRMEEFKQALFLRAIGEEERANAIFEALGDFHNASELIAPVTPRFSTKQLRDDKTSPKSPVFTAPDGTRHRYQIYKGVRTWVEAKAFCEVLGGHLATLTTAEENEFVHNFMLDSGYFTAYFGLSDEARTGDWEWVTGEPFDFSNWNRGEPSRSARERYGMYFYKHTDGTWNDSHFYELAKVDPGCSFICEWDE